MAKETQPTESTTPTTILGKSFKKCKTLERMRTNPVNDWTIDDVNTVCRNIGMELKPPASGSHFKVTSELVRDFILTIPARKPIKSVYIKRLVALADQHLGKGGQP